MTPGYDCLCGCSMYQLCEVLNFLFELMHEETGRARKS